MQELQSAKEGYSPGRVDMSHFNESLIFDEESTEDILLQGTVDQKLKITIPANTNLDVEAVNDLSAALLDYLEEADSSYTIGPSTEPIGITPLADHVLVRPHEPAEKTSGGILLPKQAQERPRQGEVLAVGKGRINSSGARLRMSVKPGHHVAFTAYGGVEIEHKGEKLRLLKEDDILAIIRPEPETSQEGSH